MTTPININSTVELVAKKFEDAKLKAIQELINEVCKVHYNNGKEMPSEIAWPPKEIEQQIQYMEKDGFCLVQQEFIGASKTMIVLFGPDGNVRAQRTIELVIKPQPSEQTASTINPDDWLMIKKSDYTSLLNEVTSLGLKLGPEMYVPGSIGTILHIIYNCFHIKGDSE